MNRPLAQLSIVALAVLSMTVCGGGGDGGGFFILPPSGGGGGNEIGPAGGTLIFSNGVKLVFPAGAVDAPTVITVEDLPAAQINAILSNPVMIATRTKRFLGGFSAKPDGLTFNAPVQAWIPVLPLGPYEIPVQLSVRLNEGTYRYGSSSLEYDGSLHMVKLELQHFSDETIGGLSPEQFDLMCTSCGTFDSGVCEAYDPLQNACCMLPPATRTTCAAAAGCDCCREKRIIVTTTDTEISGAGCVILGNDIRITYPDCPGSPTEADSVTEKTCEDLTLELTIKPLIMDLPVNQERTFEATATGRRGTKTVFQDAVVFPIWKSDEPSVADFVDLRGNIRGNAPSLTTVTIRASLGEISGVEATASVNVFCQDCTVEIQAPATRVNVGGSLPLTAIVRDSQGALVDLSHGTLSWSSSDPAVAFLHQDTGRTVTLEAATAGTTVVTATYKDIYEQHSAFVEITVQDKYTVIDLGTLGADTFSMANDINNSGKVVGESRPDFSGWGARAFLYSDGVMTDLGSLSPPDLQNKNTVAYGINDSNQIVGCSTVWKQGYTSTPLHAFLYSGGVMTDLGTLLPASPDHVAAYSVTCAYGINSNGQIVGSSNVELTGRGYLYGPHAFLYSGGVMTDLGTLLPSNNSALESVASDINDDGQIVGWSNAVFEYHAFLYGGGVMTELGTLSGWGSAASAINASGQIAGLWYPTTGSYVITHAFLYSGGVMTDLGTLGGTSSRAYDINIGGQVVGFSQTADGATHAFLWTKTPTESGNGVMTDLNTLIDPASGWTLIYANAINDLGQIAGYGWHNGMGRAFLLSPYQAVR